MEKASKGKKKGKGKSKPDAPKPESSKPRADDGPNVNRSTPALSMKETIIPKIVPNDMKLVNL